MTIQKPKWAELLNQTERLCADYLNNKIPLEEFRREIGPMWAKENLPREFIKVLITCAESDYGWTEEEFRAEIRKLTPSDMIRAACGFGAFGTCCCTCRYLVKTIEKCTHLGGNGVCGEEATGFACTVFNAIEDAPIITNWDEHGMCEMYQERKKKGEKQNEANELPR